MSADLDKYTEQCKAIKELAERIAQDSHCDVLDGDQTEQLSDVLKFFLNIYNGNLDDKERERETEAKRLEVEYLDA